MHRRVLLGHVPVALGLALAGCVGEGETGTDGTPRSPSQVTTTGGGTVEFLVSQIAIAPDAAGPDAYYRLRNAGEADAVVRIETSLSIENGGTYSAFALVSVPAGDEVTVRYRIVDFDELSEEEARRVRQGDGVSVEVRVNGERRDDL